MIWKLKFIHWLKSLNGISYFTWQGSRLKIKKYYKTVGVGRVWIKALVHYYYYNFRIPKLLPFIYVPTVPQGLAHCVKSKSDHLGKWLCHYIIWSTQNLYHKSNVKYFHFIFNWTWFECLIFFWTIQYLNDDTAVSLAFLQRFSCFRLQHRAEVFSKLQT